MSKLVGAVKTYAYMDRGGVVEADLHEGLESTLVILGHKLKHTTIEIVRDYDRTLPKLMIRGSELNQVWTNLIHNAIDALGESGTITITTRRDGPCALVEISDDGPGIAPEIRSASSTRSSRRRRSARAPGWASRSRGGSSSTATTAR